MSQSYGVKVGRMFIGMFDTHQTRTASMNVIDETDDGTRYLCLHFLINLFWIWTQSNHKLRRRFVGVGFPLEKLGDE